MILSGEEAVKLSEVGHATYLDIKQDKALIVLTIVVGYSLFHFFLPVPGKRLDID